MDYLSEQLGFNIINASSEMSSDNFRVDIQRHIKRFEFWSELLKTFKADKEITSFRNLNPTTDSFISGATGVGGISWTLWLNKDKPIQLKAHRDKSQHEYKRFVNVMNDSNYCMAIYEGNNDRGKIVLNNLDAARFYNGKTSDERLVPLSDENDLPLKCILKTGTMLLFYEKSPEELYECSVEELSKRLYKVIGLSTSNIRQGDKIYSYGMIDCRHHMEARKSSDLKAKKGVWTIGEPYRPIITISHKQFRAFVEGQDFDLSLDGQVKFKH